MHHIAFVLHKFSIKNKNVELVLPQTWQVNDLFDQLQKILLSLLNG